MPEQGFENSLLRLDALPGFGRLIRPHLAASERDGRPAAILVVSTPSTEAADRVGGSLSNVLRATDLVMVAGDEALVLLWGLWELSGLRPTISRIQDTVADVEGVRVGVAVFPGDGEDASTLLAGARRAAAVSHPPGVGYVDGGMDEWLRTAGGACPQVPLSRSQFELDFQPIMSMATRSVVGAEALMRWNHPVDGRLAAGVFIDEAERSGRVRTFDRWACREVVQRLAEWRGRGWQGWISVNLSPATLEDPRRASLLPAFANSVGLRGRGSLVVEITERRILEQNDGSREVLDGLREAGIHLAVDDFGAGYSALEYLAAFDADIIKLDQKFLAGLWGEGPRDRRTERREKLLAATIRMAHDMGKPVVAEGVETPEVLNWLVELGCDLAQGWAVGRPMTAEAFSGEFVPLPLIHS